MARVLHVIETLAPQEGGPPRVVISLAAAQRSMGIEVDILCGDGGALPGYAEYWQRQTRGFSVQGVYAVAERSGSLARRTVELRRWLRKHVTAYDVVHIHHLWRLVPMLAAGTCRRQRVPYLIAPHTALSNWALSQKRIKKALARRLVWNRILSGAAGFHALNELEAAEIKQCIGRYGPPVFVVPNGVSPEEFSELQTTGSVSSVGNGLTPPDGAAPFILFLARLHIMKGPDLLLDAFALIAPELPRLQLVFAGPDFGLLEQLQRRAAELKLLDRLHFPGLVLGSDRLWLLRNAVCLAQPSRNEGFSLSILEAMACGRAVVISDCCKFPQVAKHGAGIVVPLSSEALAAALRLYAGEPARRIADGQSARLLVERFYNWKVIAGQVSDMYAHIIREQTAAAGAGRGSQ